MFDLRRSTSGAPFRWIGHTPWQNPRTAPADMWQDCPITLQHTRPCYAKSSYRSVDPQTLHGNVHQVDHAPNGPTNSAAITTVFPLRLCGGKPLVAVTRERRYGPSRLRVNDDDDDDILHCSAVPGVKIRDLVGSPDSVLLR